MNGDPVLVTGCSSGIGKATARRLLEEGASVVLSGTRASVLEAARAELDPAGERTALVAGQVTGREQARDLVAAAVERFGGVDVLVNSTGIFRPVPFLEQTEEHLEEALGSILRPTYWVSQAAALAMRERGGGAIVNVVNIGAKAPGAGSLPTSVSRAAGIALTKAASKDLAKHNIRVNAVCIGLIKSDQHARRARGSGADLDALYEQMAKDRGVPLGRVGEAEEAGDLITFLVSGRGRYISGTAINMDGGASAVV